jgi:hypothetical protein
MDRGIGADTGVIFSKRPDVISLLLTERTLILLIANLFFYYFFYFYFWFHPFPIFIPLPCVSPIPRWHVRHLVQHRLSVINNISPPPPPPSSISKRDSSHFTRPVLLFGGGGVCVPLTRQSINSPCFHVIPWMVSMAIPADNHGLAIHIQRKYTCGTLI